jgi:hypothetical protein
MRIRTNVRVIKRNRQIAQYSFFVSMGVWLASLTITFLPAFTDRDPQQLGLLDLVATIVLPFALGLALFAVYMTNLWIREPRPEQVIRDGLKGMNKKSMLYHYHHSPAKHVLIAQQGVFVMIVRWQRGTLVVRDGRWTYRRSLLSSIPAIFRLDSLGRPFAEAERATEYLQSLLEPIAPDVKVQPIIVITDPRAVFEIPEDEEHDIPVLYANEKNASGEKLKPNLTDYMRKIKGDSKDLPLTEDQIKAFEEATLPADEE